MSKRSTSAAPRRSSARPRLTAHIPSLPESFQSLTPADRARAAEVWRAAHQLLHISDAWWEWWHQLRRTGDADPGATSRWTEQAGFAIDAICRQRANVPPFNDLTAKELKDVLPPVASGPDGRHEVPAHYGPSWQEQLAPHWLHYAALCATFSQWNAEDAWKTGLCFH